MKKLYSHLLLPVLALLLVSCGGKYGNYEGTQTRSYTIRGINYQPLSVDQALHYKERGIASWYNESSMFGLKRGNTSLGEKVMPWHISAAHKTLPIPCVVKVTNLKNGKSLKMRVNDRGPFIAGRIIDVTPPCGQKARIRRSRPHRLRSRSRLHRRRQIQTQGQERLSPLAILASQLAPLLIGSFFPGRSS